MIVMTAASRKIVRRRFIRTRSFVGLGCLRSMTSEQATLFLHTPAEAGYIHVGRSRRPEGFPRLLDTLTEPAPLPADVEDRHEETQGVEPDDGRGWLVIEPPRGWVHINWGELWRARELLYFLTWKDVKVRYKQTVLGVLWALLQPVLTMIVFSVFFGRLAGLSKHTGGIPYPIFVYAGLLPWTFFANAVAGSSASVVGNTNLITKVYFPRLVIPLAAVGGGLVDLGVSFTVLIGMMLYYHVPIQPQLAYVPLFL